MKDAILAESNFLTYFGTNIDRALYNQGVQATNLYEDARRTVASFINANPEEIVFTSGTTDSLHLLTEMLKGQMQVGDEILLSQMEHNSNYLPWQKIAVEKGFAVKEIPLDDKYGINLNDLANLISPKTKVLSFSMASNVLGIVPPIQEIVSLCHQKNILVIGDGAQFIPHHKIDVKVCDIDYLVFSGHKLYSTNGIGVLYGKYDNLKKLSPARVGGGVLSYFENNLPIYKNPPHCFEAGTPNIAQAISLGASIRRLTSIGMDTISNIELQLTKYLKDSLLLIPEIKLVSPNSQSPLISFVHDSIHSHDLVGYLASQNICLRAGFHCAERLLRHLGYNGGCLRVSLAFYNTTSEVDRFIKVLKQAISFFKGEK